MSETHHKFIRRAIELAQSAVDKGNHPFGALLVLNGEIILEAENTVNTEHDPTGHAELNLVKRANKTLSPELLSQAILYTSTEPCMMCCGGIYWSGISHVVYACGETGLAQYAGEDFLMPSREIFARGNRPVTIEGPILEEEAVILHKNFW
jgi:tRNA(Arg) A34 adenosine deaminase TadA